MQIKSVPAGGAVVASEEENNFVVQTSRSL